MTCLMFFKLCCDCWICVNSTPPLWVDWPAPKRLVVSAVLLPTDAGHQDNCYSAGPAGESIIWPNLCWLETDTCWRESQKFSCINGFPLQRCDCQEPKPIYHFFLCMFLYNTYINAFLYMAALLRFRVTWCDTRYQFSRVLGRQWLWDSLWRDSL